MGHEASGRANAEAQESADGAARGHVETIRLVEGLPEKDLIRHIHYFRRKGEVGHRGLAFYLLDLHKRGLYRPKAKSAAKWAAKELDLHVKFARRLIHTARKLEELKRTDRLFAEGKLPWTKVEIIASVATAKTEVAWIDYATRHGYAELRDVAARARKKEDALPGDGLGVGRAMLTVRQKVSALAHEVYERALARARDALRPGATPAEAFQKLCEMALGAAELKEGDPAGGGSPKGAPRGTPSPYTVVVHVDPEGIYVLEDGPDGRPLRRPVSPEDLARILASGARVVAVPPIAVEGEVETIAFGERGTVPREERVPPVSAEERELVLLREGLRCFACGSKDDLTIAHLVARAKGGGNGLRFLAAACKRCHGGEHEGFIRFFGERGRLKALDREGRPLDASVSDAEALALGADAVASDDSDTPLLLLEVPEAKSPSGSDVLPADGEVGPSAAEELPFSVRDLPAEIDAATWRELQDYLEWSPSRRAYLVRPERGRPPFAERKAAGPGAAEPEAAEFTAAREAAPAPTDPAPAAPNSPPAAGVPVAARAAPRSFRDFVGQKRTAKNLKLFVQAARIRGEVPGHILLSGPAGVGKSTLAALVGGESGRRTVRAIGSEIEPHAVVCLLGDLRRGDVLFIDEIHGLSRASEEALYSALEKGFVDVLVADAAHARTRSIRVRLEPFTLVGATTTAGALSEPLRSRFALQETLKPYTESELEEIVVRAAERAGLKLGAGAARAVAERAREIPREALRLFERAWDLATVYGRKVIVEEDVKEGAGAVGLGPDGLFEEERRILDLLLERGRALGLDAMSELLGTDRATLEAVHEPWLVRRGLVERTERGRMATRAGSALRAQFPELGERRDARAIGPAGAVGSPGELGDGRAIRNPDGNGDGNGNGWKPALSSG